MQNGWKTLKTRMTPALALALLLETPILVYVALLPLILIIRTNGAIFSVAPVAMFVLLIVAVFIQGIYRKNRFMLAMAILIQPVLCFLYFGSLAHFLIGVEWLGLVGLLASIATAVVSALELKRNWHQTPSSSK